MKNIFLRQFNYVQFTSRKDIMNDIKNLFRIIYFLNSRKPTQSPSHYSK